MIGFYYKEKNHYGYLFIDMNKKQYQSFGSNYNLNNWIELKYNQLFKIIDNLKENWFIENENL